MHIGLNVLYLVPGEVGGSEVYARRLIAALARARPAARFTVFCVREATEVLRAEGWPPNVTVQTLPVNGRNKPARILAETLLLPVAARRAGVDLLHSLGTTCPPVAGVPSIVSILDLIYEAYPETFPRPALLGLRALVGPAARRADRVITISQAVKDDVVARLRVPPQRVDPVLLGRGMAAPPDPTPPEVVRERFALADRRVVLCVSAALVHKNLDRLLDAFAGVLAADPDVQLVLVGHEGREYARLGERATALGVADHVSFTGWISAADLEGLYAVAACCAYPSLYEGFGLPVLEAMARGVPLACSDATSLPEVAGDAALLFDPQDTASITAAILRVLDDPELAATLRARGLERAARFTWERCAEGVLAVYDQVLADARTR
jgi:glycosyltransferase involved in cell wall biosynthesis